MSWKIRFKDNKDEKFFQTIFHINGASYPVGQRFYYKDDTRDRAWDECLECSVNFEKNIIILISDESGKNA